MRYRISFLSIFIAALTSMCMVGCNPSTTGIDTNKPPSPILEPTKPGNEHRKPGNYCFFLKESNASLEGSLTYGADGMTEGQLRGTIIDADNGAEAVTNTSFKGSLRRDTLFVDVLSDQTGSKISTQEKWVWKDSTLAEGGKILHQIACH